MIGTTTCDTLEIDLIPPKMINNASTVITIPVIENGILYVAFKAVEIEFACVRLPIPKEAITANKAKSQPIMAPVFLWRNAFFMVYIGPPDISPFSFTSRYLIASIHSLNFDVIPNAAESHIHTKAPGPPDTMAVATPTIFPVPIVAAKAVVKAEKGETSPSPFFSLASLLNTLLMAYGRLRQQSAFVLIVRKIPVPTNKSSITGPQTTSSIRWSTFASVSVNEFINTSFLHALK